jgi:molybdate transport repressor ModE-like protein
MDWDLLRIFLTVAREGQILSAARKMGLNHATVARRLDALEASLDTRLFDRRPSGSVLTQAGERLLASAEKMETELAHVLESTRAGSATISGTVRIGAPDGLGNFFLSTELGIFNRHHPDLTIELVPLPRAFSLSRREADLAICLDPPTEGRLTVVRLGDYSLGVYASRAYAAANGLPQTIDEVSGHMIVTGIVDYAYASSLDYAETLEKRARRFFRCASVVAQMEAVKAGVGLGVLHDFVAHQSNDLVRILPEISFRRSYFLLAHPDTQGLSRIAAVREFLTRRFRERRAQFLRDDAMR